MPRVPEERRTLKVLGPAHMARHAGPPVFAWEAPEQPVDEYCLVLGVGGTFHEDNQVFVVPGDRTEFRPTAEQWAALRPNLGYWWSLWGLRKSALGESLRAPTVRCVVRHQDIPRVAGSKLYG